ncbi:MAG: four helix bundle protein [Gemmatales bacterium]
MSFERPPARSFQDLIVWQKAHDFVLKLYRETQAFPAHETYCLRMQMRRAAVSIPANIAEGFAKQGKADKARFLNIAHGSLEEVRYYLMLANDLGYLNKDGLIDQLSEVSKLLSAYRTAIVQP